jgi:DNA invertase Pin-like site-specific DNA recombinase
VVIYARFSPRPDAEECDSSEKQIARCREYAEKRGWEPGECRTFHDDDESGGDWERVQFWQAMTAAKRGMVFLVYCWDRLARDTQFSLMVNELLARKGVTLYSVIEGPFDDDDNPTIKLTSTIIAAVAEFFRRMAAARTSAAMRRQIRDGLVRSSKVPFGQEFDPDSPPHPESGRPTRTRDNEHEQAQVQRVLELRRRGWKQRQIARYMNEHDRPIRGKAWNHVTVGRILKFAGVP